MVNKKIVIVEDNPALNELYTMAFSAEGYEVLSFLDGENTEEKILEFSPNIILLDIMMPKIDGLELLKRLKKHPHFNGLVIVASNLLNDSIMNEALKLGAKDFFNKSDFTPTEMVERVSYYLGISEKMETEIFKEKCPYTILLIEDNEDELDLLSMSFKEKGCKIITAKNGGEGLIQIAEHHPDIVLTDLMMPDMNGFELLQSIKENINFEVKVMIISQIDDEEKIRRAKKLGAIDYLKKSEYTPNQIVEKLIDYFQCEI